MWAKMFNILKYVWQNPIVQFACFTVIEGVYLILRKKTKRNFSQYRMEKAEKTSPEINEAVAELIIGEDKPEESEKEVVAEEAKPKKARRKKKEVILEEEPKPKKTRRRAVKKLEEGDKVAQPKRKRAAKRVAVKEVEPSEEKK